MGILEKVCSAETSKDLEHHSYNCDVDVLGAVGMAGGKYLAIYRTKYLNDARSYDEALKIFMKWTVRELVRSRKGLNGSKELAKRILNHWLIDVCNKCLGIQRTGSVIVCPFCLGSGKKKINCTSDEKSVYETILRMADCEVNIIKRNISKKMR